MLLVIPTEASACMCSSSLNFCTEVKHCFSHTSILIHNSQLPFLNAQCSNMVAGSTRASGT